MKKFSELKAPKGMKEEDLEKDMMSDLGFDDVEDLENEEDMEDMSMDKPELEEILAGFSKEEIEAYLADMPEDEDMDLEEDEDMDFEDEDELA